MEHGRVIFWVKPSLPEDQRANIRALVDDDSYQMFLVPRSNMAYAVAATAWNARSGAGRDRPPADLQRGQRQDLRRAGGLPGRAPLAGPRADSVATPFREPAPAIRVGACDEAARLSSHASVRSLPGPAGLRGGRRGFRAQSARPGDCKNRCTAGLQPRRPALEGRRAAGRGAPRQARRAVGAAGSTSASTAPAARIRPGSAVPGPFSTGSTGASRACGSTSCRWRNGARRRGRARPPRTRPSRTSRASSGARVSARRARRPSTAR